MPLMPTRHLVVSGLYRHMRNPMYVAVASLIAGQALLFGDLRLLTYAACVWAAFHLFVLLYEEPTLMKAYPEEYPVFRENVPRWIPRIHPWRGDHVPSRLLKKGVGWRCERRGVGCKALRRRRCSSHRGGAAMMQTTPRRRNPQGGQAFARAIRKRSWSADMVGRCERELEVECKSLDTTPAGFFQQPARGLSPRYPSR